MRFAFSTRALDIYPTPYGAPVPSEARERLFRWGIARGFDGIEIEDKWVPVESLPDGELEHLRDQSQAVGITPTLKLHYRDLTAEPVAKRNEDSIRRAIEGAAKIAAPIVSFSMPTLDPIREDVSRDLGRDWRPSSAEALPGAFERTVEAVRRLARIGQDLGVVLAIEMHQGSIADTGESLLRLLDAIDQPNVGANPDLANLMQLEPPPAEDWRACARLLAPRTVYWHVKNIRRYVIGRQPFLLRRGLDEGFVDYRWCVAELLAHGFDGFAVIEASGYGDHLTLCEQGREYLARLVEERRTLGI
jgi:sugar phosphate isomerase/epimerase